MLNGLFRRGRSRMRDDGPPVSELTAFHSRECSQTVSLVGKTIAGRYDVVEKADEGGLSIVYRAADKSNGNVVAVKAASDRNADMSNANRYVEREARAVRMLCHPNIPYFIESCSYGGIACLVREFLEGRRLTEMIGEPRTIPLRIAIPIFLQVCDALSASHAAGIVHSDVKLDNIFITKWQDGSMRAMLIDFGFVRFSDASGDAERSPSGFVLGTARYMAPEQLLGESHDHRADVYGLGIVMYRALWGGFPFDGDTPVETAKKVLRGRAEPPSRKCPGAQIPAGLEAIVMRAIERKQDKRFQSVIEMRGAIESVRDCG